MLTTQLRSVKELQGYKIQATDGEIGKVHEFYFDDEFWVIRYLVADIGHWAPGRKVLISPLSFDEADWGQRIFHVKLTRQAVEKSPDIDTKRPVSRQQETALNEYYNWQPYWTMAPVGNLVVPVPPPAGTGKAAAGKEKKKGDPHLRSTRDVLGYRIHAKDGDIGHVDDFIANDADWAIHYMVADTGGWLPGKKVLVSPWWTDDVNWEESRMYVSLPKQTIQKSPPYDFMLPVTREYEDRLHSYYGKPRYWA